MRKTKSFIWVAKLSRASAVVSRRGSRDQADEAQTGGERGLEDAEYSFLFPRTASRNFRAPD